MGLGQGNSSACKLPIRRLLIGAALAALTTSGASAANVVFYPGTDFSKAPTTISFGGGVANFTFSYINDGETADAVTTGGNGLVNSFQFFSPLMPVAFQLGSPIGETGYGFSAFTTPAGIAYSIAEDSIGLEYFLPDGVHYGYVTTLGPEILQYGFNDTPGAFIATGAGVPEPGTWAMLLTGFGLLGGLARYSRRANALAM
jgi:hypothetical protein